MLFIIFIVCSFVASTLSCSCMSPNITRSYCESDVVARVTVISASASPTVQISSESDYTVKYVNIYKKSNKYDAVTNKNLIHTPGTGASCGVAIDYKKNPDWIFFGSVNKQRISIFMCSSTQPWKISVEKELSGIKCVKEYTV